MPSITPVGGNCAKCGREVDAEAFCFGCQKYVCETCSEPTCGHEPMGAHPVEVLSSASPQFPSVVWVPCTQAPPRPAPTVTALFPMGSNG
jgi:hypothetical protein